MTTIKHISFSPSQLPDIPISPSSRPRTESVPTSTHSQHYSEAYNRFSGIFSSADVDFLVNLTLRAEWKDVEFYIQFLISHYEQFLNNNNHISEIIVAKLYELLVRVKSQKFYEAIEYYDRDTAISVLTAEIAPIAKYLSPFHLVYLQKMYNDRSVFLEYKMNVAREYSIGINADDSCVKYRNIIATELREQLNELLHMYGASFEDSHSKRGRSSETNNTPYILSSEQSPRGWKRKLSDATHTRLHTFSSQPSDLKEDSQQLKKKRVTSPETSTHPTQKLGNMDVLLEAFDIVDHDKDPKPAFQTFHEVTPAKVKHKQPKLDASIEQKITESLDFQSIKPTRTIKPVRKLCTGGITSTPAIRERMIKVLEQYKTPVTWETIQHKVSGNRAKVWATLCMFVNEGLVTQTGKGRRGHPYKYVMRAGVTVDSVQGEMENKFKKLDHEAMRLHKQYREKQQEEIQHQQETESIQHLAPYTYVHERTQNSVPPRYDSPFTPL